MTGGSDPGVRGRDVASLAGVALTGFATALLLVLLVAILGVVAVQGLPALSWRFITTIPRRDFFDAESAAVLPMIIGTTVRVLLMTVFVMPVGVITAVYLSEYARAGSRYTQAVRAAVANLAGVPSIVFGLFGLGFFINFAGRGLDRWTGAPGPVWGQPSVLWASLTLAVMTLPVVIVATEESLRSIPAGLREASLALGATKLQTLTGIVLPNARPGILTGGILAISRAAGEVAPILFTGAAYYLARLPGRLTDQFMDLGYHSYVLATQSPNVGQTRPILFATVLVLLGLTFSLNALAIIVRARMRRSLRAAS
ncbi:MAG: phosphate ABC transporter permease PstA [Verrucomicrobia bacterium]|nr:phosphate ABC transporter permease PstA [Verrucomicrobiota bacterium]